MHQLYNNTLMTQSIVSEPYYCLLVYIQHMKWYFHIYTHALVLCNVKHQNKP